MNSYKEGKPLKSRPSTPVENKRSSAAADDGGKQSGDGRKQNGDRKKRACSTSPGIFLKKKSIYYIAFPIENTTQLGDTCSPKK